MAKNKKPGLFAKKESEQIDSAYEDIVKPNGSNSASSRVTIVISAVLCVLVCVFACFYFLGNLGFSIILPGDTIAADVTIAGVDVGGCTRSEAAEVLTAAVGDVYSTQTLVVTVLDKELEIAPSVSGAILDVKGVVRQAFRYGTDSNPDKRVDVVPYLNLNDDAIRGLIQEFSKFFPTEGIDSGSEIVKETVDGTEQELMTVTVGTVYYKFSQDELYNTIVRAYRAKKFNTEYKSKEIIPEPIDMDALYAEHCIEPVDAVFDSVTHEVTQSSPGWLFDLESAKEALSAANYGDVLKFPFFEVLPSMDTETLKSMLYRDELGTYTAYQGSSSNRATNLRLACESLNGIILYPGDTFSYNQALGERTAAKGYKPADSYMGSKTVQTYGGGICQPSSCLYYSALLADLEIVERSCHGFVSSYMPKGLDATVDWNGPDFKFKNNTDFPIRIDAKADGGEVTVTLIGTDTKDYYVKMENEVLSTSYPKTIYKDVKKSSGHKNGEVETTPYTGYTVQTYKLKYSKETNELISREEEAYSVYSKRDKVVYRVKTEPKKEDKKESTTATEPTEAPT